METKTKRLPTGIYFPTVQAKDGTRRLTSIYWIRYTVNGKQERESTHSEKLSVARDLLRARTGQVVTHTYVGPDAERTTLGDLLKLYTDKHVIKCHAPINHLRDYWGDKCLALNILSDAKVDEGLSVANFKKKRRAEGAAPATINRSLAVLKNAFTLGKRADFVFKIPYIEMEKEDNARSNFIEQAQFDKLHAALPDDLKDPVLFLWLTAWRVNEMRTLEWRDVFTDAIRLRPERSKSKTGREIPLTGELAELIARQRGALAKSGFTVEERPFVFMRENGDAMGLFRKSWITACKTAKLKGTWVHDLRRSAIRQLMASGISQSVVMSISGHKTVAVFNRYNVSSSADKLKAMMERERKFAVPATPKRKLAFVR